jgi:hypothetical protein
MFISEHIYPNNHHSGKTEHCGATTAIRAYDEPEKPPQLNADAEENK